MSRGIPAGMKTAMIAARVPKMIGMVRLDFDSGSLCWNSSFNNITYGGKVYIGSGNLGSISQTSESAGVKSSGLTVGVTGVVPAVVAALLSEPYLNRPAYVYLAVLDDTEAFNALKVSLLFQGKIDSISGTQGKVPSFSIDLRSRLADWERIRDLKYTDADQQTLYPGDKGFEFIPHLQSKKITWPKAQVLPDPRD